MQIEEDGKVPILATDEDPLLYAAKLYWLQGSNAVRCQKAMSILDARRSSRKHVFSPVLSMREFKKVVS